MYVRFIDTWCIHFICMFFEYFNVFLVRLFLHPENAILGRFNAVKQDYYQHILSNESTGKLTEHVINQNIARKLLAISLNISSDFTHDDAWFMKYIIL